MAKHIYSVTWEKTEEVGFPMPVSEESQAALNHAAWRVMGDILSLCKAGIPEDAVQAFHSAGFRAKVSMRTEA